MVKIDPKFQNIMNKYGAKFGDNFQSNLDQPSSGAFTKDYDTFKKESLRLENSLYERACAFASSSIN